jgi:Zn-dependent peptidase ImmA (M78 family)/DNA-binding XRE family transcriptional regulator
MMKQANHKMIILARESREMTQKSLAERIGVAQGTLSKIEANVALCPQDILAKLAETLDYPESFFHIDEPLHGIGTEAHHCLYRKRASLPMKVLKRIEAEVNICRMNAARLLQAVDVEASLRLPHMDLDQYEGDPEQVAQALRIFWKLPSGPVDNVTELIERAGVIVIEHEFGSEKVDATSVNVDGLPPLIFINRNMSGDRWRFTLAHELGHLIMHTVPHPKIEEEADRFASEFLMPAADVGRFLTHLSLSRAAQLKPYWKVSMAALIVRAKHLGCLNDNQYRHLFYQLSAGKMRLSEPPELAIAREKPSVHAGLLDYFRKALGYSSSDLLGLFRLNAKDANRYYRSKSPDGHLRAV